LSVAKTLNEKRTTVSNNYQNKRARTSAELRVAMPETVSVAMAEIAEDMQEGLLALAVGAGLQVMGTIMAEDVTAECGPKGKHDPDRTATRHGHEAGSVTLGGRRVPVSRPRMRAADGSGEVPVVAYELFSQTEILGRMAMGRMLAGLSTRQYRVGLEPVGRRVEASAASTSKSAVSRRFVAATETALGELLAADLSCLDLVALMVDGVHFGEHLCVVALGIDIDIDQAPAGVGGGLHGEHDGRDRSADRAARTGPGHHPADLRRDRWREGAARSGGAGVRPSGDRSVSTAQDQECG
jgi:putative transposase